MLTMQYYCMVCILCSDFFSQISKVGKKSVQRQMIFHQKKKINNTPTYGHHITTKSSSYYFYIE